MMRCARKISELKEKVKRVVINFLKRYIGENAEEAKEPQGTPIRPDPGLNCPQCGFLIRISIPILLSEDAIFCQACGLRLVVDQEKSKSCLTGLKKVYDAVQEVEKAGKVHKATPKDLPR